MDPVVAARTDLARTLDLFNGEKQKQIASLSSGSAPASDLTLSAPIDVDSHRVRAQVKYITEYRAIQHFNPAPPPSKKQKKEDGEADDDAVSEAQTGDAESRSRVISDALNEAELTIDANNNSTSSAIVTHSQIDFKQGDQDRKGKKNEDLALTLVQNLRVPSKIPKPGWHAPWKLMRVISGHLGWVRSIAVDPANEWFATGSGDHTIKIWDVASGSLKLTLTGHIGVVRGLAVSKRHPYLFSVGDDKMVKCWDLEQNKVIRHFHGHLSGVYDCDLHPALDLLVTGGRDSSARVWDIRTRNQVFCLSGHTNTVCTVRAQTADPQILSGSMDTHIRLWDLAAGKTYAQLTNHKKSVRAITLNPAEWTFCSAGADNVKQWAFPEGKFLKNFSGHNTIIHTMSINHDNVMVTGGDDGSMKFWDCPSGHCFQTLQTTVQPGSLESEAGIFASTFDLTGSRLFTCEADKTIKVWKEDEDATPETHPVNWTRPKKVARF